MISEFQQLSIPEGKVLFREGEQADCAYAVIDGSVQISVERDGDSVAIATLGPGEIFGEMAIIASANRSATAMALSDCTLQRIEAQQFTHRVETMDPVMRLVIEVLLARFRNMLNRVEADRVAMRAANSSELPHFSKAMEHLQLEHELKVAIRDQQLKPYYQPIVCLATGKLAGFEALIRWHHPVHGTIMPDAFIPTAEQSDLIRGVTSACLLQACHDLPELRIAALGNVEQVKPVFMSVNITGRDLANPDLIAEIQTNLDQFGLTGEMLKLEITENSLMHNLDAVSSMLLRLRELGIGIAIDDFGTGYSSMSHLTQLPISTLKIDRSFISAMPTSQQNRNVVKTILHLARELGVTTVAEGVDSLDAIAFLAERGCEYVQGYYYSKPVPLDEAVTMIENWRVGVSGSGIAEAQTANTIAQI